MAAWKQTGNGIYGAPMCPCANVTASTLSDEELHEQQMGAFYYACSILLIYASLILYFMLKQVWKEEKANRDPSVILANFSKLWQQKEKEDLELRHIKKQLCMHLIQMGQMGLYVSSSPLVARSESQEVEPDAEEDDEEEVNEATPCLPPTQPPPTGRPPLPPSYHFKGALKRLFFTPPLILCTRSPSCSAPEQREAATFRRNRLRRLSTALTVDQGTEMEDSLAISVPSWPRRSVSADIPSPSADQQQGIHNHDPIHRTILQMDFGPKVEELVYLTPAERRLKFCRDAINAEEALEDGSESKPSTSASSPQITARDSLIHWRLSKFRGSSLSVCSSPSYSPLETTTQCIPEDDDDASWI